MKTGKKKGTLIAAAAVMLLLAVSSLAVFVGGEGKSASRRIKIEVFEDRGLAVMNEITERTDYEMLPFFIPLEGGKGFLRLKIRIVDIKAGWDRRISINPHKYREAILRIFDEKKTSAVSDIRSRSQTQREIGSKLISITGESVMEGIIIEEYRVI